jgi:8-oxo-dGTP pyrophosphatase MutT (NUDIX family)
MDLDAHPTARLRVACYVTRERAGRLELLVFDHGDFPEAGTQIPAGGVEPAETFPAAALREVREETGLDEVEFVRLLGESDRPHPTTGDGLATSPLSPATARSARGAARFSHSPLLRPWLHGCSQGV